MVEGFEEKFVMPGDTFELRCKAKGSPLPEVSWRIDGDHLYKSERHKISSRQNAHETEAVLQVLFAGLNNCSHFLKYEFRETKGSSLRIHQLNLKRFKLEQCFSLRQWLVS